MKYDRQPDVWKMYSRMMFISTSAATQMTKGEPTCPKPANTMYPT
jgi:hypothetical protein